MVLIADLLAPSYQHGLWQNAPYQYYLEKTGAISARAALTSGQPSIPAPSAGSPVSPARVQTPEPERGKSKEFRRLEAEQRQAKSKERKTQQDLVRRLEKEIHELEIRQAELAAALESHATYQTPGRALEINRELSGVVDALAARSSEWEHAATRLADIEKK